MPQGSTQIDNPAAHLASMPHWHTILPSLPPNVTPSDIDGILERNNNFLTIETKKRKDTLNPTQGQGLTLHRLAQTPNHKVLIVWMKPPTGPIYQIQKLGKDKHPHTVQNQDELNRLTKQWWDWATNNPWTWPNPST